MVKLYEIISPNGTNWVFAPNKTTVKNILFKESLLKKGDHISIKDVTSEHLYDDGLQLLRKKGFIGVPQRKIFMLNGCMSSMEEHYETCGRSSVLWWSEKIPESKGIWK